MASEVAAADSPIAMAAEISEVRLIETPSADKLLCFKETNHKRCVKYMRSE